MRTESEALVDVSARMAEAYDTAQRGDYPTALDIWGPLAHAGVARAQNNVGACFAEGLGVERNASLALRWLTLAAEAGDPVGQRNLAALYFKGEGVEQDHERAANLYRAASEAVDAAAQDMLSWMLLEEAGAVFDPVEARRWALLHYLDVRTAGSAGFGFDRSGSAGNLLVRNVLGRAAQRAFDAWIIPERPAQ